jgi:hypothetical protein
MGVFKESLDLLNINYHVLSGDNHNPMLVERVNRYLNEGLHIMTNERNSIRTALEAILLSFTHGTPVLFRVPTFPAASLPSAVNSLFSSTSLQVLTRSLRPHLVPSLPILRILPSALTHVRISPNYSFASSFVGIGNSLMLAALILASTLLVTSFLFSAPLDPIPSAERSINSCTLLQDHGVIHAPSQVLLTNSSLSRIQSGL